MNQETFKNLLYESQFAEQYYSLCSEHLLRPSGVPNTKGKKEDVISAFKETGKEVKYIGKYRFYEFSFPQVNNTEYFASLFFQRHGIELTFGYKDENEKYNDNLAVLAHDITTTYAPSKVPDPPYPRPDFSGDLNELHEIIIKFVKLIDHCYEHIKNNS